MAWPPATHQDVTDELAGARLLTRNIYRTGAYYTGAFSGTLTATQWTAGFAYFRPFVVFSARTFDRISVNVDTATAAASGGVISAAIYEPGTGRPGPLLLSTASVSTETSGAKEWVISAALTPGFWWVAARVDVAEPVVTGLSNAGSPAIGWRTTTVGSTTAMYSALAVSTGATWPADLESSVLSGVTNGPHVGLRAA